MDFELFKKKIEITVLVNQVFCFPWRRGTHWLCSWLLQPCSSILPWDTHPALAPAPSPAAPAMGQRTAEAFPCHRSDKAFESTTLQALLVALLFSILLSAARALVSSRTDQELRFCFPLESTDLSKVNRWRGPVLMATFCCLKTDFFA